MMGRLEGGTEKLFYGFSLADAVPSDHLLRKIDRFLDFGGLRAHLRPYYSDIGRPSVDPALMIRMLIVGYCFGIRSERRLCEEVHLNLAYRWFCRLGLEDRVSDHSTFSKARHGRFRESDLFRKLFESTVVRCMAEGGEGFASDASLIRADASRKRSADGQEDIDRSDPALASRPVAEYLDAVERQNTPPKTISLFRHAAALSFEIAPILLQELAAGAAVAVRDLIKDEVGAADPTNALGKEQALDPVDVAGSLYPRQPTSKPVCRLFR